MIDDLRTISNIDQLFFGSSDGTDNGLPTSFNDSGQIAFRPIFTDGTSGFFVATIGLAGDLNGDGFVGIADLNAVLPNWNQAVTPWDFLAGDTNGDGFVGIEDLNEVLGNWNAGTPPPAGALANVPEPGIGLLVWLGLGALSARAAGRGG